jgi:hypothetical protein
MTNKHETRLWRPENLPFIILGALATLGLTAACVYLWVIYVTPVIAQLIQ